MLKLILYKEKHTLLNTLAYLLMLLNFSLLLIIPDEPRYPYFVIFWYVLMSESLKYGLFDLTVHFSKNAGFSAFKIGTSHTRLNENLKMLSIPPIQFAKTNLLYTILRLIPFWLVIMIFEPGMLELPWFIFSALMLLKAIIGPIHSIIVSMYRDIQINEKSLSNKEKRHHFFNQVREINPYLNTSTFRRLYKLFTYGFFGVIAWLYIVIFGANITDGTYAYAVFDYTHPYWLIVLSISLSILVIYSTYIFLQERRLEHEIYRS